MGYRSEVVIDIAEHEAKILELLCEHSENLKSLIGENAGLGPTAPGLPKNLQRLRFDHIKWYEGYEEINLMENFLSNIDDEAYHYLRVGEDYDDMECRGFRDSGLYINRSIESW